MAHTNTMKPDTAEYYLVEKQYNYLSILEKLNETCAKIQQSMNKDKIKHDDNRKTPVRSS